MMAIQSSYTSQPPSLNVNYLVDNFFDNVYILGTYLIKNPNK